jgi:hypothetical protein
MFSNGLKEWPVICRVWSKTVYHISCVFYMGTLAQPGVTLLKHKTDLHP